MKIHRIVILLIFIVFSCLPVFSKTSIFRFPSYIDLTHTLSNNTIHWAVQKPFQLITSYDGQTSNHHYYSDHQFSMLAHIGTHIDAPKHFYQYGEGVAAIPLQSLIGDAVLINVNKKIQHDVDYQISVEDLVTWQNQYGKIPMNSIVLFNTGYENYWPNRYYYFGTNKVGYDAKNNLHFPGLSLAAAKWLIQHKVKAIGIDTASIDYGLSKNFLVHQLLAKYRIPIFENLTRLNKLSPKGNYIIALPLKVSGSSGAPLRIIALKETS